MSPPRRANGRRRALAAALGAAAAPVLLRAQTTFTPNVGYVPTPPAVVQRMVELARVGRDDVVYDLGCGDGRLVIEAARRGAKRGVGIDIDPELVSRAQGEARRAGVAERVSFRTADLFQSDFSDGTVVMLYLLPELNLKLRPQLWRQLPVGARVVSHAFSMGDDWPPQHLETLQGSSIYVWTITEAQKRRV